MKNQGIEFVLASSEEEVERWYNISAQATERLRELNRYSESLLDEIIEHVEAYRVQQRAASSSAGSQVELATPGQEAQ